MESNLVQNLVNLKGLPQTWVVKDFKEVVSDNSGGNKKLAKSNFLNEGEIAVVDQGKKLIAGYYNNTSLAVKTQPPYVVFGDHTRAFKYVDFPFIMGADGTKVLQPKKENCDTKYLYYFFLSINVPNTGYNRHFKYLKKLKIPIPPLDQQKKIATILDEADAYRQKTKALISKYDELTQSLFLDMFGDPVTNPNRWEKVLFSDIATFHNGDRGKNYPSQSAFIEEGIPFINAGNLSNYSISATGLNFISRERYDLLNAGKIIIGDILFCLRGSLGKFAINSTVDIGAIASSLVLIRVNQQAALEYITGLLKSNYIKGLIEKFDNGSSQPNLSAKSVKEFLIPTPPIKLQNQFAERAQAIESQKAQAQASLTQAEDLFNSLLQRAFKGELV